MTTLKTAVFAPMPRASQQGDGGERGRLSQQPAGKPHVGGNRTHGRRSSYGYNARAGRVRAAAGQTREGEGFVPEPEVRPQRSVVRTSPGEVLPQIAEDRFRDRRRQPPGQQALGEPGRTMIVAGHGRSRSPSSPSVSALKSWYALLTAARPRGCKA